MTSGRIGIPAEIWRTVEDVASLDELRERLRSGEPMVMKYGVDLTAPDLHIGHAVNLWLYRAFQELGHRLVFLLGDFTTRIGDPTGRNRLRPLIPAEEIARNADAFLEQATQVVLTDPAVFEVRRNSEWGERMSALELLRLMSTVTLERLSSRDMFRRRIAAGGDVYAHELVYPLLQGWDSVALGAGLTVIGSDQLFNEMIGRALQEREGQRPQVVVTTRITPGIDGGDKQSKSLGNYVGLAHSPRDKLGRLMRIPDALLEPYLSVYTALPQAEIDAQLALARSDPFAAKLALARAVVARYHGDAVADAERDWFVSTFSRREDPADMPTLEVEPPVTVLELVRLMLPERSTSELRRLIGQGGVRIDGDRATSFDTDVPLDGEGVVVRAGRRAWARFRPAGAGGSSAGRARSE